MNMLLIICCFVQYRCWYHTCLYRPVEPATEPRKSCTCRKFCNRYPKKISKCFLSCEAFIVSFQVGMEFWARWAHRALWHASLWNMHEVSWRCHATLFELHHCIALKWGAIVGSLCVLNPQMWCNAMMSYCGKFFMCSTLSYAQQFLTRIFYVWKIAVAPQTKGGALRAQWHFCHHQCCTSHYTHGIWILQPWICSWSLLWRGKQVYSTQLLQQTYTLSNVLPGKFSFLTNLFNILWCWLWLREKDISVCVTGFRHYHVWHGLHVVHDGLVHRRFAVGPVADFPYLQKVAAAHQVLLFSLILGYGTYAMRRKSCVYELNPVDIP